jgi:pimeloyl-ACP methyl ester carboxylesterase
MATAHTASRLAYDDEGAGTPVVLLHGLTFDRRSWWPIIERLGGAVRSIAIDLPAHGESHGTPPPLEQIPARLHELLNALAVERPIVVGHSMSGGLAAMYASAYPARGLVSIDNGPHIRPFAELVRRLEPALRGPGFAEVWPMFEHSLGLADPRAGALAGARHPPGAPGRRRRILGADAAQRSGRVSSVGGHNPRNPRRSLSRRVRTADH